MIGMGISEMIALQKEFFQTGKTLDVRNRKIALGRLKKSIAAMESDIFRALQEDLGKCSMESYMTEVGLAISEISFMEKHVEGYAKKKIVPTPLAQFPAKSYELPSPYGSVLVMSPWNYPFLLAIAPTVNAIAAGNTVIIKPSAYAPHVSGVLKEVVRRAFLPEYVAVVTGGREENAKILDEKFDAIFFTGGKETGRVVMEKAAKNLTPVTLELGGKSPCIVEKSADLKVAAMRIAFGKFLNLGQTCVAPDYILVQKSVKEAFLRELILATKAQYGEDALSNPNYGKIINEKHFIRLLKLMDEKKKIYGGRAEGLRIEPTILDEVDMEDPIMKEEIFGPILPLLTFERIEEVPGLIENNPNPLALYLFTKDKKIKNHLLKEISFGGGCVNDTIIHLATNHMGFGGVGESGMGSYHGKQGFDTFSHRKSIVEKGTWLDLPLRYQPYTPTKEKMVHTFLK